MGIRVAWLAHGTLSEDMSWALCSVFVLCACVCELCAQVNVPKQRRTFCKSCRRHKLFKVSQYKAGKASLFALGKDEGGGGGEKEKSSVCNLHNFNFKIEQCRSKEISKGSYRDRTS